MTRPFLLHTLVSEKDLGSHIFLSKLGFKGKNIFWDAFGKDHDAYRFVYEKVFVNKIKIQCEGSLK
jgi:hypothetical protein